MLIYLLLAETLLYRLQTKQHLLQCFYRPMVLTGGISRCTCHSLQKIYRLSIRIVLADTKFTNMGTHTSSLAWSLCWILVYQKTAFRIRCNRTPSSICIPEIYFSTSWWFLDYHKSDRESISQHHQEQNNSSSTVYLHAPSYNRPIIIF